MNKKTTTTPSPPGNMLRNAATEHRLFTQTRLPSLYSDFRKLEQLNPDGYEANLIAWKSLFNSCFTTAQLPHRFVLDTAALLDELVIAQQGKPLCVDVALDAMVKSGELIPWAAWTGSDGIYKSNWVRPVLSWAFNRLVWDTSYTTRSSSGGLKKDRMVSKVMLERYTEQLDKSVLRTKRQKHELVFSREQFRTFLEDLKLKVDGVLFSLTELDFEVLLTYLHRDVNKIQMRDEIIKFGQEEITDEDVGICQIKTTVKSLEQKNTQLQSKIDSASEKLKQSLKNKSNKELSLNLLRSKKIAEQSLSKQLNALTQLESVLYKIDESSSNVQLLSALEKGSAVLKGLSAQFGGIDRVESIIDELEDDKYEADKISEQLLRLNPEVNDDEIEEEFAQILAEESNKEDSVTKKLQDLEIAPSHEPTSQKDTEEQKEKVALHT